MNREEAIWLRDNLQEVISGEVRIYCQASRVSEEWRVVVEAPEQTPVVIDQNAIEAHQLCSYLEAIITQTHVAAMASILDGDNVAKN